MRSNERALGPPLSAVIRHNAVNEGRRTLDDVLFANLSIAFVNGWDKCLPRASWLAENLVRIGCGFQIR